MYEAGLIWLHTWTYKLRNVAVRVAAQLRKSGFGSYADVKVLCIAIQEYHKDM